MIKNILYSVGGYDPKIVNAGRLGIKFILPGSSLLIVLITSSYGGYHLADIIVENNLLKIVFTVIFVFLVLLVDFLLLNSKKKGITALLRVILAASLGFLVAVLTSLSIYRGDIEAEYSEIIDSELNNQMLVYERNYQYSDSLVKALPQSILNNKRLAGIELYLGNPEIGSPPGPGAEWRRYHDNVKNDSLNLIRQTRVRDSLNANRERYRADKRSDIEKKHSKDLNGQIDNLLTLIIGKPTSIIVLVLIFVALMVIDLMPFTVKWGMMDDLDNDYKNKWNEIKNDSRLYDAELEEFFMENEKKKVQIENEKRKENAKSVRITQNITMVEEIKKEYANKKLQYILDLIKNWTPDGNDTSIAKKGDML